MKAKTPKRGKYKRTAKVREKNSQPSLNHGYYIYVRKCDERVGRWIRVNDQSNYDKILEEADVIVERRPE